jgi:hypothetical protein
MRKSPLTLLLVLAAPLVTAAAEFTFESDAPGAVPAGFSSLLGGQGQPGVWAIEIDDTAARGTRVVTQTNTEGVNYRFPMLIENSVLAADVDLKVRFKAVAGKLDQAAGLVWRFADTNNYYVVRANALEDNVVLYRVKDGKREDLKPIGAPANAYGKKVSVPAGHWQTLEVGVRGPRFTVKFNGTDLFVVEDSTFTAPGRIGLWTKADSMTRFDDLEVVVKK